MNHGYRTHVHHDVVCMCVFSLKTRNVRKIHSESNLNNVEKAHFIGTRIYYNKLFKHFNYLSGFVYCTQNNGRNI
jgi:hypothetical protein